MSATELVFEQAPHAAPDDLFIIWSASFRSAMCAALGCTAASLATELRRTELAIVERTVGRPNAKHFSAGVTFYVGAALVEFDGRYARGMCFALEGEQKHAATALWHWQESAKHRLGRAQ